MLSAWKLLRKSEVKFQPKNTQYVYGGYYIHLKQGPVS